MIRINDNVRHTDEALFEKYGKMEVWEIKGELVKCRYGNFHMVRLETFKLTDLKAV
jgi:hypothetical protein